MVFSNVAFAVKSVAEIVTASPVVAVLEVVTVQPVIVLKVTLVKLEQPPKADLPIFLTPLPIVTLVKPMQ